MNNIGVIQGHDGLPEIYRGKDGKSVSETHKESYELRFADLHARHMNLKAESSGLRTENANLRMEIERLKHGNGVDGDIINGEVIVSNDMVTKELEEWHPPKGGMKYYGN